MLSCLVLDIVWCGPFQHHRWRGFRCGYFAGRLLPICDGSGFPWKKQAGPGYGLSEPTATVFGLPAAGTRAGHTATTALRGSSFGKTP